MERERERELVGESKGDRVEGRERERGREGEGAEGEGKVVWQHPP